MEQSNERNVTLTDYLNLLYRGRWIILLSFVAVLGATAFYTFTAEPVYEASAKLMIKEEGGMQRAIFEFSSFMKKETMINNQVEILKSRSLAEKVIRKLQASEYRDQLRILGNKDTSDEKKSTLKGKGSKWFAGIFGSDNDGQDGKHKLKNSAFELIVQELRNNISVNPIRETDMIEVKVKGASPFEATYITNTLANVYKDQNQLESQEEVRQVKNFLEEQLQIVQEKLGQSELVLKEYKEKEKLVGLPEETQELISKLAEFESLYQGALTDLHSNEQRLEYINRQLDLSKQNFNLETTLTSPYLETLKQQMAELEAKKAKYIAGLIYEGAYDANNAGLKEIDEKLNALKEKLKKEIAQLASTDMLDPMTLSQSLFARKIEVEAELQSLHPRVKALKKIVDQYNNQLESLPEKSLKLARLEREAKVDEKIYLMMQEKFEESRITEVGQLGNVRIIDPAKPPTSPIHPKKKLNLILGTLMGLGLGIGVTFFKEYLDNSVRTIEDVENLGLPFLGSIPVIKSEEAIRKTKFFDDKRNGKNRMDLTEVKKIAARLITHFAPKSPISEAYRALRTNIQYSNLEKPLRTILVTSPGPGEGKSTTVVNLAITMAQMGSKTLLVDADLRRPVVHSIFGLDKGIGLSNFLVGKIGLEEAVFQTEISNLYVMPSGTLPPNPSEMLGSSKMKQLLEELKENYDMVLFDSPPLIAVTDAAVLSSSVDGIILILKSGQTDKNAALRSCGLLKNIHAHVLGALLNVVQVESIYSSYYYYYHYYYYYGKSGEKRKKKRA